MDQKLKPLLTLLGVMSLILTVQVMLSGYILFTLQHSPWAAMGERNGLQQDSQDLRQPQPASALPDVEEETTVSVSSGTAYVRGNPAAPIIIIEFSDFQCPFCLRASPVIKEILSNYDGKVSLAYRHLPLGIHEHAYAAATTAEFAGEHGLFWEMHDLLFEKVAKSGPDALKPENLVSYASELNLNGAELQKALDEDRFREKLGADVLDAQRYNISGTPTFFINGRKIVGARSYDELASIIDDELKKLNAQ